MATPMTGEALAKEAQIMRKLGLQLAELQEMGLADLRGRHLDLFGEEPRSKNLVFLRRKLAFRLQEQVEGGLSIAARERLEELSPQELPEKSRKATSHGEVTPPAPAPATPRDQRLPAPGTLLRREFRGFTHEVEVLQDGFAYRGRHYMSLSTLAKEITGTAWNGFTFFGLGKARHRA